MDRGKILSLPKTELHCHLDGSLSLACMENLLHRKIKLEELQVASDCKDLATYLEKFNLPLEGLQTRESLKLGAIDFIENVSKENVEYVEVRFAPMLSTRNGLSEKDVIESVLEGLSIGKDKYGVESNVIASMMRHHNEETNLRMIKAAREFLGNGLCAIDLAGDESSFPIVNFVPLFCEAKKLDIPFTIHAGECGSVENVVNSIIIGTTRIGHGISLRKSDSALYYAKINHIGIEMCPISNLQTKAVKNLKEYPIKDFLNKGLLVTINTDNRMVSNTSLTKEFEFIQENYGVTDDEIIKILNNSIEVSFASDELKENLRKNLSKVV